MELLTIIMIIYTFINQTIILKIENYIVFRYMISKLNMFQNGTDIRK